MSSKTDLNAKIQQLEAELRAEQLAAKALQAQRNDLAAKLLDAEARAMVAQHELEEAKQAQKSA